MGSLRRLVTVIVAVLIVAMSWIVCLRETRWLGKPAGSPCLLVVENQHVEETVDRLEQKQDLLALLDPPKVLVVNGNKTHAVGVDRNWCPTAKCYANHLCRTCERRFLIIIATGRSASTTLTWMLDMLPNVRMSGENNDAIKRIKRLADNTFGHPEVKRNVSRGVGSWGHNAFPPGHISCVAQTMIESMNPPDNVPEVIVGSDDNKWERVNTILGFKTVRLHDDVGVMNLPAVVRFLEDSFPCARFVVNYRGDIKAQAVSLKKSFPDKKMTPIVAIISELQRALQKLQTIARLLGRGKAYVLDSSLWTKNVTIINEMVSWLGFNEHCYFSDLLEYNTNRTGYTHGKTQSQLQTDPECQYSSTSRLNA